MQRYKNIPLIPNQGFDLLSDFAALRQTKVLVLKKVVIRCQIRSRCSFKP